MAKTIVITGANRGIGLGLTKHMLMTSDPKWQDAVIYATHRKDQGDLPKLSRDFSNLKLVQLDVGDQASVASLVEKVAKEHGALDMLINNAGVMLDGQTPFPEITPDNLVKAFEINTVAPVALTQAFLPTLEKAEEPMVAHISSMMGSITDNLSGGFYGYRMSKAALNMFCKSFAIDYPNITSCLFHPGWVQTEMGGPQAKISVEECTAKLSKLILGMDKAMTGHFVNYEGNTLPW